MRFFVSVSLLVGSVPAIWALSGQNLRILPLGDSITYGSNSADGNGYRRTLLNDLAGNNARFIGSVLSGNMVNPQNEGHPGYQIDPIGGQADQDFKLHPNVVLLLGGTNDIVFNADIPNMPTRLGNLIDKLITNLPGVTVLVGQIPPFGDAPRQAQRNTYNAALPGVVNARINQGKKVLLVDTSSITQADVGSDNIHPNANGYAKLGHAWFAGIQNAVSKGLITPPIANVHAACGGWNSIGQIATGVGLDPSGIRLADLTGDGLADYLFLDTDGSIQLWQNLGQSSFPAWTSRGKIALGVGQGRDHILFGDINGDGLLDYVAVQPSGDLQVWYNSGLFGNFAWDGPHTTNVVRGAHPQESIRLADVNGDKIADILAVDANGFTTAYLSNGPLSYQSPIVLAQGVGSTRAQTQFVDITGDGLADYITVDATTGSANAWVNGGPAAGGGWNWQSSQNIAAGTGSPGTQVSVVDITGDGLGDYVVVNPTSGGLNAWINTC